MWYNDVLGFGVQHCIIMYKEETNRMRPMSSGTNELVRHQITNIAECVRWHEEPNHFHHYNDS